MKRVHQHIALKRRREGVKERLEAQLESGVKPIKGKPGEFIPLTPQDIKRINKEIEVLNGPIMKYRKKNRKYDKKGNKLGA